MPDGLHVHTTSELPSPAQRTIYSRDVTDGVRVTDPEATVVAFAGDDGILIFVGNSSDRTAAMAASYSGVEGNDCAVRLFSTVWNEWQDKGRLSKDAISSGIPVVVDAGGFAMLKIVP